MSELSSKRPCGGISLIQVQREDPVYLGNDLWVVLAHVAGGR